MSYTWSWEVVWHYREAFFHGLETTIALSLLAIALATIIGITVAMLRVFGASEVQKATAIGTELFRAIPIIVLLVWIFYAFPVLSGVKLPAFETAVIGLTLVEAAFIAEIVRAGIDAIPKGQIEAAKVLGMNKWQIAFSIALPQALLKNLPVLIGEYTTTIKNSTLAVIIGVNELLHTTNNAASLSYRPMELYTVLGILFLLIIIPLSLLSKKIEYSELIKTKT